MTDLQADYPDDLRVLSTVIPKAFIGGAGAGVAGFPYSLTSGALQGPFNVAPWPSIQFYFIPSTVDQRVVFTWYDDALGTNQIGTFNFNMRAGIPLAQVVRNMGPFVGVQVISAAGGVIGGSLWVGGSTRTLPGVAYQTTSFIVDWGNRTLNPNANFVSEYQYGYMGPARLKVQATTNKWRVEVFALDILGNSRPIFRTITAATDVNEDVFCPALILQVRVTNLATVAGTFYAVLYQAQLP